MNIKESFWLEKSLDLKYVLLQVQQTSFYFIGIQYLYLYNPLIIKTFASLK